MNRIIFLGICLFFWSACTNKNPNIIEPQKMKFIMWELTAADEWFLLKSATDSTARPSKLNEQLYQQIFKKYGVTKKNFYQSLTHYQASPELMRDLLDSTLSLATKKKDTAVSHIQPTKK